MGGNLFKLGRLPKTKYLKLEQELRVYLDKKFGEYYRIPRYYGDKPDFGDVDILISGAAIKTNWEDLKAEIRADLSIQQYQTQNRVLSTVYKNFQTDFFLRSEAYFETTYNFMSFNDIGNIIGKIFKRFNLLYGEKGLEYVFRRADGHFKKNFLLCQDFKRILQFLELDISPWEKGFETRKAMFDWVTQSPYFSIQPYQKLSASLRKRQRERQTMQHFIAYLESNQITKNYTYLENRDDYLPWIAEKFPEANLLTLLKVEKEREHYLKVIKEKYNGRIVMSLFPNLKGKALGLFMQNFQESLGDYEKVLFKLEAFKIQTLLKSFYQKRGK